MRITPFHDPSDRRSIISRSSDNSNGSSSGSGSASIAGTTVSTMTFSTLPASITTSASTSTIAGGSPLGVKDDSTTPLTTEYDVWRRWEDCLFFQDVLEVQYTRMSREKRARLHAGKGVKKNGLYEHEDPIRRLHRAASFESLPPGPDPSMVAKDLHEVLPRLTKKGTIFKASKETVTQRGAEFAALIEALLGEGEDVPKLITELRQLREVRDFFGWWRRDHDRVAKDHASMGTGPQGVGTRSRSASESVASRASNLFGNGSLGMYFNASNLSVQLPAAPQSAPLESTAIPAPGPRPPRRPAIMANGRGAMMLPNVHTSASASGSTPTTPRQRAQTIQGPIGMAEFGVGSSYLVPPPGSPRQPTSAPAGGSFHANTGMDDGYVSDAMSATDSVSSSVTPQSPTFAIQIMQVPADAKGKGRADGHAGSRGGGPIIVSLEEGEALLYDEDAADEHPRLGLVGAEMRRGLSRGLQDLTIQEEDERDVEQQYAHDADAPTDYPSSDYQHSESSARDSIASASMSEDEPFAPQSPSMMSRIMSLSRRGMLFRPSVSGQSQGHSSSDEDSAALVRTTQTQTQMDLHAALAAAQRPRSPVPSTRSQTPISSARIAAAHADALSALTGGPRHARPASPVSARSLAAGFGVPMTGMSMRASVRTTDTTSSRGSGSNSVGSGSGSGSHSSASGSMAPTPLFDAEHARDSLQSSILSCVDLESRLSSSPVAVHSPLLEESHDKHLPSPNPTASAFSPYSQSSSSSASTASFGNGSSNSNNNNRRVSVTRSRSVGSRGPRMSQMPGLSEAQFMEGDDLLDTYFYGSSSYTLNIRSAV